MTDYPFITDGCSGGMSWAWRKIARVDPPWEGDCVNHDLAYHLGGSRRDRLRVDVVLMCRVAGRGHPFIAIAMFLAVRVGGHPLLPLPWRWGYGWRWPRGYRGNNRGTHGTRINGTTDNQPGRPGDRLEEIPD